jgi:hypothetical protein
VLSSFAPVPDTTPSKTVMDEIEIAAKRRRALDIGPPRDELQTKRRGVYRRMHFEAQTIFRVRDLQIAGVQTRAPGNSRQHPGTNFVVGVKRKYVIGPARPLQNAMRPT